MLWCYWMSFVALWRVVGFVRAYSMTYVSAAYVISVNRTGLQGAFG